MHCGFVPVLKQIGRRRIGGKDSSRHTSTRGTAAPPCFDCNLATVQPVVMLDSRTTVQPR